MKNRNVEGFCIAGISILVALVLNFPIRCSAADLPGQDTTLEKHSVAEWLKIALTETKDQKQWEATHPQDGLLLTGAGQLVVKNNGKTPDANLVSDTPEFNAWWKSQGAAGLEQWAKDDFPTIIDRDHLIYNTLALYSAVTTPRTSTKLYVNGEPFSNPVRFWTYYDRIKKSGAEVYRQSFLNPELSRNDYNLLRFFAPIVYCMWQAPYTIYDIKLEPGDYNSQPVPGMAAPDFTLSRLEWILQSPNYTDAYSFDYRRPFHSEIAAFLLYVSNGYERNNPADSSITAKPSVSDDPNAVTLSASHGKRPVVLIFGDPIDDYFKLTLPFLEPLYQATKDKMDWYFICDDVGDNIIGNYQKAMSMEERAQTAKGGLGMAFPNLSFPILLDDMAQHTQMAYFDPGGLAKVILIDKNGIIACNCRLYSELHTYLEKGTWGYQQWTQAHCVLSANIKTLLDNNGIWTGKPTVVPDWGPPATIENVKIASIDMHAGTITIPGADGKEMVVAVDKGTRIISQATPDLCKSLSDLTVGTPVSCLYEPSASGVGSTARYILLMNGQSLNDYFTSPVFNLRSVWCPAVVTGIDDSLITAALVPRAKEEMRGLNFWEQPNTPPMSWEAKLVKSWVEDPGQKLDFHVDRGTEVIMNGMKGKLSDIQVGDHLGVEIRPDQTAQNYRPHIIFVYRYNVRGDQQ